MAANVIIRSDVVVGGETAIIAARFCNFVTGDSRLLKDHVDFINTQFKAALQGKRDVHFDVYAYASKTGSASLNQALSEDRRDQMKAYLNNAFPSAKFVREAAFGEQVSAGAESDNDGFWRAVEVRAFGKLPAGRGMDHVPPKGRNPPKTGTGPTPGANIDQWFVTNVSLSGVSIVPVIGGGGYWGSITFEHVGSPNEPKVGGYIVIGGVAAGISEGIPGLKNTTLAQKAIKFLADAGGFSSTDWPSTAAGICYRNPVQVSRLQSTDFKGDCVTAFINASIPVGGCAIYLLYFGLPTGFWFWPHILALAGRGEVGAVLIGAEVAYRCKGIALISTFGVGLSASIGVAINGMVGRIS